MNDKIKGIETLAVSQLIECMNLHHKITMLRLNTQLKSATIESDIYDMIEKNFKKNQSKMEN